ncbi:uncharacterized protein I206_103033 [Kwoniella pini CBS 10737]|uniref:Ribosome maturation protein SDO1/SBDS N-terminal domain-containing protein n=1 Tax=Kwoniella pini CBS 10737 TaxID=1296096 RepID=A0A1B9IAS8_9TREE|nr:uncharacterized protein I206_01962 [Kwoniella pini CBS 10737]OCF52669.1 hypothetical protein I206_01962 [Kwoniella pini CBS 10737]
MATTAVIWSPENSQEEFLVFVDDVAEYERWKGGATDIALSRFVGTFSIMKTTNSVGHTGQLGEVSKQEIQNVFFGGDKNKHAEEAIEIILKEGKSQKADYSHSYKLTLNPGRGAGSVKGQGNQQGR